MTNATESVEKGGQGGDGEEEEGVQPRAKRKSNEVEGEKEEEETIKTARPECCKDCRIIFIVFQTCLSPQDCPAHYLLQEVESAVCWGCYQLHEQVNIIRSI